MFDRPAPIQAHRTARESPSGAAECRTGAETRVQAVQIRSSFSPSFPADFPHPSRPRPEAGKRLACGLRCGGDVGAAVPAAFLPLSRRFPDFVSVYCAKSAQNARTDRKISVFPSIRAYFASIHTQFGLLRRLRGSGGRPCGLAPPRAPPCRLLFRRAPRAAAARQRLAALNAAMGSVSRAFQRPAAPSERPRERPSAQPLPRRAMI